MKAIVNIVVVLANVEAIWLFYVLSDGIIHYGGVQTGLTRLAGFQIIVSAIVALACLFLARKQGKNELQEWAFAATGFAILGLCAALVGAYPFLIGKAIR
jgi:hypothetical protein